MISRIWLALRHFVYRLSRRLPEPRDEGLLRVGLSIRDFVSGRVPMPMTRAFSPPPPASLPMPVHQLCEEDLSAEVTYVRSEMYSKFGQTVVDKRISLNDWARWAVVLDRVKGASSLLDVGTAHGTFINAVAASQSVDRLIGIDIREYSLYTSLFPLAFDRIMVDAADLMFDDDTFDVVVAMEILEHQKGGKMEVVLQQLRRVAREQLIVTVPFCEPLPLSKHHSQQFDIARVRQLFPRASYTLLLKDPVTRVPWLLIQEPQSRTV